jgi:hypothetical protein
MAYRPLPRAATPDRFGWVQYGLATAASVLGVQCHESAGLVSVTKNCEAAKEGEGNEEFNHTLDGMDVGKLESDGLQ